jgi:hypothetical protein
VTLAFVVVIIAWLVLAAVFAYAVVGISVRSSQIQTELLGRRDAATRVVREAMRALDSSYPAVGITRLTGIGRVYATQVRRDRSWHCETSLFLTAQATHSEEATR